MRYFIGILVFYSCGVVAETASIEQLIYQIRNPKTQSSDFRKCLKKIGEYLALDTLKELDKDDVSIETLTGAVAHHQLIQEEPILVTILRAGLPLNQGLQAVFKNAEVGFLAMSRDEITLQPKTDYIALPYLQHKVVILSDTMLATGGSMLDAIQIVKSKNPKKIFVVAAIASKQGLDRIQKKYPEIKVFVAAIDPELNEQGYIIPGLGDAGDRAYGKKN